jgi:Pyridoxamine 5'-phosphate oxidase
VSIEVPVPQLFDEIDAWGFGYLVTVSDGDRPHLLALRPVAQGSGDDRVLRFDAGGGRACRNADVHPSVSIVFPPNSASDGMSLVVDGDATVDGDYVDVRPTWAVLHRKAPAAPA